MRIADFLGQLGEIAPFNKAASWDPVGLQLGDPDRDLDVVAVCHEVTHDVLGALLEVRPRLVVTYHPLLFEPVRGVTAGEGATGKAFRLLEAGIALAVAHTNFDTAPGGAADALADALGLHNMTPFGATTREETVKVVTFVPETSAAHVREAMAAAGAGEIGSYRSCSFRAAGIGSFVAAKNSSPAVGERGRLNEEQEARLEMVAPAPTKADVVAALVGAHPYEEPAVDLYEIEAFSLVGRVGHLPHPQSTGALAELVAEALEVRPVRHVGSPEAVIRRVAVVPGSGGAFLDSSRAAGADALVTGDVSHHRAAAASERGFTVVDPGHAATERPGLVRLVDVIAGLVETIDMTDHTADPWRWTT